MIEKAKKYTKKYELSDGEFQMFMNLLSSDMTQPYHSMFNVPASAMSRTLGYSTDAIMGDKLQIPEGEHDKLEAILRLDKQFKQLYNRLVLQTLMYTDCHPEALLGEFDKKRHNQFNYVHPVIAALFLPKIKLLDEHMLLASISNIVKLKSEGKPLLTQPEFELYWDLITDPNQTVCVNDNSKTLTDLLQRVQLQNALWESVMKLRTGKYYDDNMIGFFDAVEKCQNSLFDAPDLTFSHDEGTILRRLLNAFSLRPTVVSISSFNVPQNALTTMSLSPSTYTQVTTTPMLNLRLPSNTLVSGSVVSAMNLTAAMSQPQWYIEGKVLVPKTQSVVHSRDVLFFYVDRKFKTFNYMNINRPYVFTGLPKTLSGIDSVNDMPVKFNPTETVGDDQFELRSVVCVDLQALPDGKRVITGCVTCVRILANPAEGRQTDGFIQYDPQGAGFTHQDVTGNYVNYGPITGIAEVLPPASNVKSFYPLAEKYGSLFVYVKRTL
jgi:hypothetical protein